MKVLLLGNYSGLGMTLKEGLLHLGIDVTLVSNGDGWKRMPGSDDILFPTNGKSLLEKVQNYIVYPSNNDKFRGFDIVQAPGPNIFFWGAGSRPFNNIARNNGKFFINAAGVDYYLFESWKKGLLKYNYYMYDDNPLLCSESDGKSISSIMMNLRCKHVMRMAHGIIPVIPYEYEESYKSFPNLCKPILLPVNIDKHHYRRNIVNNKIVVFHGINRSKDKGSDYIKEAMLHAQNDYPKDIECVIADRMPYEEYLYNLERANIIIDQCKSYGYGMNALISMAKGKVVFSGAEDEVVKRITPYKCPVVNIRPEVKYIYEKIISFIDKKETIPVLGKESREYVQTYHNYIDIAKKYVQIWNSY